MSCQNFSVRLPPEPEVNGSSGDFCCVPGCSNSRGKCKRLGKQVSFYKFPSDAKRRQLWLNRIRRDVEIRLPDETDVSSTKVRTVPFEPSKSSTVCSEHFVGGLFCLFTNLTQCKIHILTMKFAPKPVRTFLFFHHQFSYFRKQCLSLSHVLIL